MRPLLIEEYAGYVVSFDSVDEEMIFSRPAQLRALAKWLVKCADFIEQEQKDD